MFDAQKIIDKWEIEQDFEEPLLASQKKMFEFAVAECQKQQDEMVERLKKEITERISILKEGIEREYKKNRPNSLLSKSLESRMEESELLLKKIDDVFEK